MAEGGVEPTVDTGTGEDTDHPSFSDIGSEGTEEGFKTGTE
jgi:hypothetical protein